MRYKRTVSVDGPLCLPLHVQDHKQPFQRTHAAVCCDPASLALPAVPTAVPCCALLSAAQIELIVTGTLSAGTLTYSANSLYLVLTDNTIIADSGFCTS